MAGWAIFCRFRWFVVGWFDLRNFIDLNWLPRKKKPPLLSEVAIGMRNLILKK